MVSLGTFPALGLAAALATSAILALEVILACGLWQLASPARVIAVIAFISEAVVLVLITTKLCKYYLSANSRSKSRRSNDQWGAWFALDLMASVLASVVSAALLISLGKAKNLPKTISTIPITSAVVGSSIALGFAFVGQLLFVVVYFILHRRPDSDNAFSLYSNDEGRAPSSFSSRVKTVPYSRTKPALSQVRLKEWTPSEYSSRPGTSSGRSATDTITSYSGSLSSSILPTSPRAMLLSNGAKFGWRPDSLDSNSYRDRSSVTDDRIDSWDSFSVDSRSRKILEATSPTRTRFLDPIPASPANSRSPSPGRPLDLELPKKARVNRSHNTVIQAQQERALPSPQSELHIHPLFRSDSPCPPPAATPGTVVIAAPNAGQFITGKSVAEMRSGMLSNPLSRQTSYETLRKPSSLNGAEDAAKKATRSET